MKKDKPSPPKNVLRFFRWYCHPKLQKYIEGDLMELYEERVQKSGKRKADIKFIIDVILLFRPGIIRPAEGHQNLNTYGMYKSYFKIGWRNLVRNKGYALINIGGLALGMMVAMLIGLWIYDELSYNKSHKNYDRIAKIYRHNTRSMGIMTDAVQTAGLGTLLKSDYPEHFEHVVLVRARPEQRLLGFNENKFVQSGFFMQDGGPQMLSLNMKQGVQTGLKDKNSILLSESFAKKMFGDKEAINQTIVMDAKWDLKVTGVYEDLPKNTEFNEATFFAPVDLYLEGWSNINVWDDFNMWIYVQIPPNGDFAKTSEIIKNAMIPHIGEQASKSNPQLFLHPMSRLHLSSQFKNGVEVTSDQMKFVWLYGMVGIFVLLLACINFMNLSTARSEKRAKEVGIRKSIGSYRSQLVQQFFSESLLVTLLSFIVATILTLFILSSFNSIAGKNMSIPWSNPFVWIVGFSFTVLIGLLAGSYPALFLSSFNPVKVLKGTYKAGRLASLPRRVLVVVQFTVSIALIAGTMIVYQQIQFAKTRPSGYTREGLISLRAMSPEFKGKLEVLRNELKKTGAVVELAESDYAITSTLGWNGGFDLRSKPKELNDEAFNINEVTHEYGKTIGWEFVEGRDFSREFPSDLSGVVINESTKKTLGMENPVGEKLIRHTDEKDIEYTILGVIRDVVKGSPFEPTNQCLYFLSEQDLQWIYIRTNPEMSTYEALTKIEKAFSSIISTAPFDYKFSDEEFGAKFRSEERIGTLAAIFSVLAIIISCSGLFGLASFVAEQRTKEIGIRKVLGASVTQVWKLLSSEFVLLVAISIMISIPLSYWFMDNWLRQYQYRTTIAWYVFAVAGTGALFVTLLTVSFQAIKAAVANPVKSLRSE
ncbi:MAG: FtsX-like permease family protein [Bacteroidota bacterium]